MAQVTGEDGTPRVIPLINGLYDLSVDGRDVETELARWRNGAVVELSEPRG